MHENAKCAKGLELPLNPNIWRTFQEIFIQCFQSQRNCKVSGNINIKQF